MVSIISVLVYYYFSIDQKFPIQQAPTTNSVINKVSSNFDLSKDTVLYNNVENGELKYSSSKKSYILTLPAYVTFPVYDSDKKQKVELEVAKYLGLTSEEFCYLPLSILDYRGDSTYVDSCLGEE